MLGAMPEGHFPSTAQSDAHGGVYEGYKRNEATLLLVSVRLIAERMVCINAPHHVLKQLSLL